MSEIIFSTSNSYESRKLSKLLKSGRARSIAPRVHTSNMIDSPEEIIQRNIFTIIAHFYPNSVLSHRSAFEIKPKNGALFLSGRKRARVEYSGVILYFLNEAGPHQKDMAFLGIHIAHEARAYLENLTHSKSVDERISKNLTQEEIESKLLKKLEAQGEEKLNQLRDEARTYALEKNMQGEFEKLNKIIGSILGTKDAKSLINPASIAFIQGEAYDEKRMSFFTSFFAHLNNLEIKEIKDLKLQNPEHFRNKAFFESYFSNFIEGTEFEIEEAEEIIFEKKIIARSKDAHDILGTFEIVSDASEMRKTPQTKQEFLELLCERHLKIMAKREEVNPGKWKDKNNRAGNTHFVDYKLVEGTLKKVFELIENTPEGMKRALLMMLAITEIHPFTDGNGRIARIMTNAELEVCDLGSIIIPNVYREDYLLALKAASRQERFTPLTKMLIRALEFSSAIDFSNYKNSLEEIKKRNWFLLPSEGKLIFRNHG